MHCLVVQAVGGRKINCPAKVLALHSSVWDSFFLNLLDSAPGAVVPCPVNAAFEPLSILLRCILGLDHLGLVEVVKLPAVLRCRV